MGVSMKKDNRGVTLVELIIVMAILAVLAGTVGLGIGLISGKPADKCASKMRTVMQNNRVTTMGKLNASLQFYVDADGSVWALETIEGSPATPVLVGEKSVSVQYTVSGDATHYPLGDATNPLIISFNRSSGAFNDLSAMGLTGKYCDSIVITKGSTVKTLKLSYLTGKISLE